MHSLVPRKAPGACLHPLPNSVVAKCAFAINISGLQAFVKLFQILLAHKKISHSVTVFGKKSKWLLSNTCETKEPEKKNRHEIL